MIDFACKTFKLKEVMRCGLSLSKAEFEVFSYLLNNKNKYSTNDISKNLNLDISTVQKAVKKLHEKSIISRSQINLKTGYQFYYQIKSRKEIKVIILDIINNWSNKVEQELDKWI